MTGSLIGEQGLFWAIFSLRSEWEQEAGLVVPGLSIGLDREIGGNLVLSASL